MANYKFYDFYCESCNTDFKKGMWIDRDGNPEGVSCETCSVKLFPVIKESGNRIMINTMGGVNGADWKKGLSSDWKDYLKVLKKRNSRGDNNIDA